MIDSPLYLVEFNRDAFRMGRYLPMILSARLRHTLSLLGLSLLALLLHGLILLGLGKIFLSEIAYRDIFTLKPPYLGDLTLWLLLLFLAFYVSTILLTAIRFSTKALWVIASFITAPLLISATSTIWQNLNAPEHLTVMGLVINYLFIFFIVTTLHLLIFAWITSGQHSTLKGRPRQESSDAAHHFFWFIVALVILAVSYSLSFIVSLFIFDLVAIFTKEIPLDLLHANDTKGFLLNIYIGTFASFAVFVALYVAYIRNQNLKNSERQFEHTQKQFDYTQQQDRESEVEKRFHEGIKLLGDSNESVRIGAIYILWEIVKDAVKALPYLEQKHGYVYYEKPQESAITPYIRDTKESLDPASQSKLKRHYLQKHHPSSAQINAYLKAYSLHEQILNILCGHIRSLTNTQDYLLDYYPSIARKIYQKPFMEHYGEDSVYVSQHHEEPSNEINILFHLLTHRDLPQMRTITNALNFRLDFSHAILKGIHGDRSDLSSANLRDTNFANAQLNYVDFRFAHCERANFKRATLNRSDFTMAHCQKASFHRSQISSATFHFTNCIEAIFTELAYKAYFYGASMQNTLFSLQDFLDDHIRLRGINGLPGIKNITSLERKPVIQLIDGEDRYPLHPNQLDQLLHSDKGRDIYKYYMDHLDGEIWRISIKEAYFAYQSLRRSGETRYLGESYTGYRSLELTTTREYLQVFQRHYLDHGNDFEALFDALSTDEKQLATEMFTDFDKIAKARKQAEDALNDASEKHED